MKKVQLKNGYYKIKESTDGDDTTIDIEISSSNIRFFRYRTINDNTLSSLLRNEFWVSDATTFNDPYDTYMSLDFDVFFEKFCEIQGINIEEAKKNETYYKESQKSILLEIKKMSKTACLSEIIDNPVMWSHYSNEGSGFALEYSFHQLNELSYNYLNQHIEQLMKENNIQYEDMSDVFFERWFNQNMSFFPMNYRDKAYDFTSKMINEIYNQNNKIMSTSDEFSHMNDTLLNEEKYKVDITLRNVLATHKSSDWRYEREWRLNVISKNINERHTSIGVVKPKAIYLGEFISETNKLLLCYIARKQKIQVYQMETKYSLDINKLTSRKLTSNEITKILNFNR